MKIRQTSFQKLSMFLWFLYLIIKNSLSRPESKKSRACIRCSAPLLWKMYFYWHHASKVRFSVYANLFSFLRQGPFTSPLQPRQSRKRQPCFRAPLRDRASLPLLTAQPPIPGASGISRNPSLNWIGSLTTASSAPFRQKAGSS